MTEEAKESALDIELKSVDTESKNVEKLSDDDIRWRAKYKLTKSEYEDAKLKSEKERSDLIQKVDSTQKERQVLEERLIHAELKAASVAAGIKDLELVRLIDTSQLKVNDNGSIEGIEKAISDFKSRKPDFFGIEKKISSSTNAPVGNVENKVTVTDARSVSKDDWRRNKQRYMSGNFN